jgi:hypothetical protein
MHTGKPKERINEDDASVLTFRERRIRFDVDEPDGSTARPGTNEASTCRPSLFTASLDSGTATNETNGQATVLLLNSSLQQFFRLAFVFLQPQERTLERTANKEQHRE